MDVRYDVDGLPILEIYKFVIQHASESRTFTARLIKEEIEKMSVEEIAKVLEKTGEIRLVDGERKVVPVQSER